MRARLLGAALLALGVTVFACFVTMMIDFAIQRWQSAVASLVLTFAMGLLISWRRSNG